jgi:hypothetical protein
MDYLDPEAIVERICSLQLRCNIVPVPVCNNFVNTDVAVGDVLCNLISQL